MGRCGGLAVYVTSHGFGHLNRTAAVLNRLPADLPLVIRGHPSLFDHWRERLKRPARLEPHISDAGAVNPPGDSAATDIPATIALATRVHAEAMDRVDRDAQALRHFDASQVAAINNVSPLLTIGWGVLLLGEALTSTLLIGGALTLVGVAWSGGSLSGSGAPCRRADASSILAGPRPEAVAQEGIGQRWTTAAGSPST